MALQSAVWFSPDGHFSEYADPSTRLVDSFPIEAEYGPGDSPGGRSQTSVGWTFELTAAAPLEALGVYDYGADGLLVDHLVGVWKLPDGSGIEIAPAEPIAMSLVESGNATPFDGQWRYSESLYSHPTTNNALSSSDLLVLDQLGSGSVAYWEYYRGRVQSLVPGDPLQGIVLEPGNYAILSNQIASATNRDATSLESADLIDLDSFVAPFEQYPGHDSRLDLSNTAPIGPDAYDGDALGQPQEFSPTNVQLFNSMMVGPTLFLGVPEPSSFWLLSLAAISAQVTRGRGRA